MDNWFRHEATKYSISPIRHNSTSNFAHVCPCFLLHANNSQMEWTLNQLFIRSSVFRVITWLLLATRLVRWGHLRAKRKHIPVQATKSIQQSAMSTRGYPGTYSLVFCLPFLSFAFAGICNCVCQKSFSRKEKPPRSIVSSRIVNNLSFARKLPTSQPVGSTNHHLLYRGKSHVLLPTSLLYLLCHSP